jgi:sulfur-oxidizing protein SoxZ
MKKLMLALASIALMATATMADAPAATEVKMKIKAKEKAGLVKAKVSISHAMLTYDQAKKKGLEANFITHITATVGDKVVYDASTSQFLSKNPLIKFSFAGKKGDEIKITYTQLKGETFFATKKIK